MRILALETSTELGSCALWCDGALTQAFCPAGRSHSDTLLPLIGELLAGAGLRVADLDGIAYGAGPGAFTGLRVACAVAQGMAVAANLPLAPVASLAALAWQSGAAQCLAVLDARMGEVYSARYRCLNEGVELLGDIVVGAPGDVELPTDGEWVVAGNALAAYPELAGRVVSKGWEQMPTLMPEAGAVAVLAAPTLIAGKGIDAADAAPYYVRDKVAQTVAERLARGGRA